MASIKRNYVYNLSYQILTLITPFITTPYVTRIFSPQAIGLQSFSFSLSQTFGLLAWVGIFLYGQREVSYAQNDRAKRTQIFWEVQILSLITSLTWAIFYILVVIFYIKHDYALFLILILNIIPFNCVFLFNAMEEFGKATALQFIFKILGIAFIFIFIKKESDLTLYVLGSLLSMTLPNLFMWLDVHKHVDLPDWKTLRPFRNMTTIISLFLPTISAQIYSVLDKLMLGFIATNTTENGYYELSLRISIMPLMAVGALSTVVIPRIGYLFKANERELLHAYIYRSFKFTWFASVPLCFGLMAVSDNFVAWFFGAAYAKVSGLLKLSSFITIINGLAGVSGGQYMIPTGQQNKYTLTIIIGSAFNFVLNIFLIPNFYSYGALIASILGELTILFLQFYFLSKEFSIKKIISFGFPYIFAGLIMFAVLRSFSYKLPLNPLGTAIIIVTGSLIYFGILFVFRDEFFIFYSQRTINFIKRKSREILRF